MRLWPWAKSDVDKLVATLEEAAGLLELSGDTHWAEWMRTSAAEIRAADGHGVERVLRAYGGMGSFNDVVFADPRLGPLRSRIFALADGLRREGM